MRRKVSDYFLFRCVQISVTGFRVDEIENENRIEPVIYIQRVVCYLSAEVVYDNINDGENFSKQPKEEEQPRKVISSFGLPRFDDLWNRTSCK